MTKLEKWASCSCPKTNVPCPHLEKLLPQMDDGDHPKYISDGAMSQMTMSVFQAQFPTFSESRFLELMRNYGFTDEWDLTLLSDKYFRGLSDQAIFEARDWASRPTVNRRLKQLRELLRERGFEQEHHKWGPKT